MPARRTMMETPRTGAIVVPEGLSIQALLADFADGVRKDGYSVGGLIRRDDRDAFGVLTGLRLVALDNGEAWPLDPAASRRHVGTGHSQMAAAACMAVRRAVAVRTDLVVVPEFAEMEAAGGGLADEAMLVMSERLPLLIAVGTRYLGAWMTFCGGLCALLEAKPTALRSWWDSIPHRHPHQG